MIAAPIEQELIFFFGGAAFALIIAFLSYKARFLTGSGAFATFVLGAVIFGLGGLSRAIPILTFFIFSSLLSKTGKKIKSCYDLIFEKGSRRDFAQVVANGGVGGLAVLFDIFYQDQICYYIYLGALAAATADTWATEIGVFFGQKPRLILNFKSVPSGTSGGITLAGSLGALGGACVLALSGYYFFPSHHNFPPPLTAFFIITVSGLVGSMADSLIGATVQVQYQCPICHQITEKKVHCTHKTEKIKGISWINNDAVNFFATLSGAACAYFGVSFWSVSKTGFLICEIH
jgi:uncharacterized protein (TIGR00297 family)